MSSVAQDKPGSTESPMVDPPAKPVKEKKPPTEKQIAQRQGALAKMMEKRKEIAVKRKETKEQVKQAKKLVEDKIIKEDLGFVTKQDFDSMRKELMELRALHEASRIVAQEKPKAAVPERIVERIVEKQLPTPTPTPSKLTGHALLDRLFFEK